MHEGPLAGFESFINDMVKAEAELEQLNAPAAAALERYESWFGPLEAEMARVENWSQALRGDTARMSRLMEIPAIRFNTRQPFVPSRTPPERTIVRPEVKRRIGF